MKKIGEHKSECNCAICKSGIEKREYAAWEIDDDRFIIVSATEISEIDKYLKKRKSNYEYEIEMLEVDDDKPFIICYGAIISQIGIEADENLRKDIENFKNFAFGCIEDEKCYISGYRDIVLLPDDKFGHIPCAVLLQTDLEFDNSDSWFAHTLSLKYANLDPITSIINRDFLISLKEVETSFKSDSDNWKDYIDYEKLKSVAETVV